MVGATKKKAILLFDVDGALTTPKRKIDAVMREFLIETRSKVPLAVFGGSDVAKIVEQLGDSLEDDGDNGNGSVMATAKQRSDREAEFPGENHEIPIVRADRGGLESERSVCIIIGMSTIIEATIFNKRWLPSRYGVQVDLPEVITSTSQHSIQGTSSRKEENKVKRLSSDAEILIEGLQQDELRKATLSSTSAASRQDGIEANVSAG